jgi:hypothetical protein
MRHQCHAISKLRQKSINYPPPVSEVIDYQGKIAELVAAMSLHEQEQALKMIEILALKLD